MSHETSETLAVRMERRSLRLLETLDLAAQIAAELAGAHERGVIHGALTPAQVRICPVERVELEGWSDRGDPQGDVRALGGILCEMLAGGDVPSAVWRIVERALAQAPAERYGRVEEMLADLQAAERDLEEDEQPTRPGTALPPLLTGRRISHFQIAELLGGGGMGVVYRAEDIRLGRTVALKFLAPELGRDPLAKTRFLTEARAASALEHPNLCTILDVGESEEGLLFLAMPLYAGESLERRLARGPLTLEGALDITTQAARGLAEAHRHGVVHRDIKPANLFLTGSGGVKVLDFGIAKLTGQPGPTREGSLLGTPFYMAPEQMRGQEVDARADVWSLGAVLYQMLAGRPPFAGGTGAAVVHAVLYEEPEPLANLCPEVPAEIARIVSRMLERAPEWRYADVGEALADLRRAEGLTSTAISAPMRGRAGWMALGLALVLIAIAGLAVWQKAAGSPPVRFSRLTDEEGQEKFPSLSPEGKFFVYAKSVEGRDRIFLQRVAGGNPIDLTVGSPGDDTQPAYSPDGQQIAFRSERDGGGIFLMGATGESVRRLTDFGFNPTWSPDGREIAVATESSYDPSARVSKSQIFRVGVTSGTRRALGVSDGLQPAWSPHGWRIAYWGVSPESHRRVLSTVAVAGGAPAPVIDDSFLNWSPAWSPEGTSLYFASDRGGSMNLWRVPIDERSGQVLGRPQPINTPSEWSALPSFSRDGRLLVYATVDNRSFVEQVAFDAERGETTGPPAVVFSGARPVASCELSPDGRWLVFSTGAPQEDLFLMGMDGKERRQLTNDPARDRNPQWSPDGRRILFYSNRSGKYEAWTIRPDGSGLTQVTNLPEHNVYNPAWSPDGSRISFTYGPRGTALMDLSHSSELRVLPPVPGGQLLARAAWSGDGRFLAGQLLRPDESPVPGIVLWRLADNAYRRLTSAGNDPKFFHSGTRILYTEPEALRLANVATGEVRTLLAPPPHSKFVRASVGPGDRTLCTVRSTAEGDVWLLSLAGSTED